MVSARRIQKTFSVLFLLAGTAFGDAPPESQRLQGKVVVLDPGHAVLNEGGALINPGARARRGAYERNITLLVAEKMAPMLEAQGARVYLTRTRDNPWRYSQRRQADNRARAIFANGMRAHVYVRIHCDWNRSRHFKGFTTYYYRWGSRDLAKSLDQAMAKALPNHRNNGLHRRSFVSVTARMPAVLMEIGALSYRPEGKALATDAFQTKAARALADGIAHYLQKS